MRDKRMIDVVIYIASLSQSAYRFARGQAPFDFKDTAVAEYLMAYYLPFIEKENESCQKAHEAFIQNMVENGWTLGPEDFKNKTHPNLVSWNDLSKESRNMYGYTAAVVCSAKGFYLILKADLEEEFIDSFDRSIFGSKGISKLAKT